MTERTVQQSTIPPNSGMAFEVARGQHLRVSGTTIADFVAFNRHDLRERFDQARTKTYNSKIWISTGDLLLTKANNPLLLSSPTPTRSRAHTTCRRACAAGAASS